MVETGLITSVSLLHLATGLGQLLLPLPGVVSITTALRLMLLARLPVLGDK